MKSIFVSVFFFIAAINIQAESNSKETEDKASLLYREGKYAEALDLWYGLVNSGNTDPNLFFNIGSAESLLGHIPESILSFEKAGRLRPADGVIRDAIKKERAKIDNAVIPVRPFFLIEWYRNILAIFRPGGWVLIGLLCVLFGVLQWLVFIKAIMIPGLIKGRRDWYFTGAGILFVLMGVLSFCQLHKHNEAIVMTACDCRKAASAESPLTRTLNPGEKVSITDHIADWNKVSLLNLDECWIKMECLEKIEIGVR